MIKNPREFLHKPRWPLSLITFTVLIGCDSYVDTAATYTLEGAELSTACMIEQVHTSEHANDVAVTEGHISLQFRSYTAVLDFTQGESTSRDLSVKLSKIDADEDALKTSAKELYNAVVGNCIII